VTPIHDRHIVAPAAWRVADIGGKQGLVRALRDEESAAIRERIEATRHLPVTTISRAAFDHPTIRALMAEVRASLLDGRGAIVLQRFDVERYGQEDYERAYWGLGTHLGRAASQSKHLDKLGYVEVAHSDTPRGYRSDRELLPHTDFHEVMSLASVRNAESGGVSGLTSGLSVHNVIREERPDLLPALYEGFNYALVEGEVELPHHISEHKVPVFSEVDGQVSVMHNAFFIRTAARRLDQPLTPLFEEALDFFKQVSLRNDLLLRFMLEPGEMLFWHNFTQLHSKTEFRDSPRNKRRLLRLLLNIDHGRPVVPELAARVEQVDFDRALEPAA